MAHWSAKHIEFLRTIVPELSGTPIYLLRNDEHPGEWEPSWQACFSPLGDLRSQPALERLCLWSGRGVCIRVREDFENWSNRCKAGTLLHEAAHGLEYLSQPDALITVDELSPVARELLSGNESEILRDAGIDRNTLIRGQHGADFVRLAMHLYWRARQQTVIAPSDLQFMHKVYSLPPERYNDAEEALSSELAMSRNLDLRRLRAMPAAFLELFR